MSMFNMVKGPKLEVNVCKMLPESQNPGLQPALNASFSKLSLLPRHDDIRLSAHAHKQPSAL